MPHKREMTRGVITNEATESFKIGDTVITADMLKNTLFPRFIKTGTELTISISSDPTADADIIDPGTPKTFTIMAVSNDTHPRRDDGLYIIKYIEGALETDFITLGSPIFDLTVDYDNIYLTIYVFYGDTFAEELLENADKDTGVVSISSQYNTDWYLIPKRN